MESFTKPTNLNGTLLASELEAAGVNIAKRKDDTYGIYDVDGELKLDIPATDRTKAQAVLDALGLGGN